LYKDNNWIHVRCNWTFVDEFLSKFGFQDAYQSTGGTFEPISKVMIAFPWPDYPREKMKGMTVPHLRVRHSFAEDVYPFDRYVLLEVFPPFLALINSLDLQYTFRDDGNLRGTRYHIEVQQTSTRTRHELLEPFKILHGGGQMAEVVGSVEADYAKEVETAMVHLDTPQEATTRILNLGELWERRGNDLFIGGCTLKAAQCYGLVWPAMLRATNRDRRLLRVGGIDAWDARFYHLLLMNRYNLTVVSLKSGIIEAARQSLSQFEAVSRHPRTALLTNDYACRALIYYLNGILWFVQAADCESVGDLRSTVYCFTAARQMHPVNPWFGTALRVANQCLDLYGNWELSGDLWRPKDDLVSLIKSHVSELIEIIPMRPMKTIP